MLESSNPFKQDYFITIFFSLNFTGSLENVEKTLLLVWDIQFEVGSLIINMIYHKH